METSATESEEERERERVQVMCSNANRADEKKSEDFVLNLYNKLGKERKK